MSGRGLHVVSDIYNQKKLIDKYWEPTTASDAIHEGFAALDYRNDQGRRIEIVQKVRIERIAYKIGENILKELNIHTYFDLESRFLVADEIDLLFYPEFPEGSFKQKITAAQHSSEQLKELLDSSEFRELSHDSQQKQLDLLIAQAEEETGLRDLPMLIEGSFCYSNSIRNGQQVVTGIDISSSVISGICLGVEALENLGLKYMSLRQDRHMISQNSGICLVIDPDSATKKGLQLQGGELLFVPVLQDAVIEQADF